MKTSEELAQKWLRECDRDCREAMASSESHARITAALSFRTGNIRTVSRRKDDVGQVTLPTWALECMGIKIGEQLILVPTERGTVELRAVTEQDLDELARYAVERASRLLPAAWAGREGKHVEKQCEQCRELYLTSRAYQKFCPACGRARKKASMRAYDQAQRNARRGAGQTIAEKAEALR